MPKVPGGACPTEHHLLMIAVRRANLDSSVVRLLKISLIVLFGIFFLWGLPARACTPFPFTVDGYETIIVGEILDAKQSAGFMPGSGQIRWEGTISTVQIVKGNTDKKSFRILRGGPCDDGVPVPAKGEKWVLYFNAEESLWPNSYPVDGLQSYIPELYKLLSR